MSAIPTDLRRRSALHLEALGWTVAVAECRSGNISRDLFGIFDLVALRGDETLGVQVTDYSHLSLHRRKITEASAIDAVRKAGWRIRLHGWKRVGGLWRLNNDEDLS